MKKRFLLSIALVLFMFSAVSYANEWIHNVRVNMVGTYQHSGGHFVWLSKHPVDSCKLADPANPTLRFSESNPGGKSLLSVLIAATLAKANVDVKVNGCDIVEVYLKSN
jgi:hypothetical protein